MLYRTSAGTLLRLSSGTLMNQCCCAQNPPTTCYCQLPTGKCWYVTLDVPAGWWGTASSLYTNQACTVRMKLSPVAYTDYGCEWRDPRTGVLACTVINKSTGEVQSSMLWWQIYLYYVTIATYASAQMPLYTWSMYVSAYFSPSAFGAWGSLPPSQFNCLGGTVFALAGGHTTKIITATMTLEDC